MTPTIREAGAGDLRGIVELTRQFIEDTSYREILRFDQAAVEDLAYRVIEQGVCFVAALEDDLVGMIAGFLMRNPIDGTTWLDEVAWFITPAHRKGRVGYYLLRSWESFARQEGVHTLRMLAPAEAPEVGEFYYRRGYRHAEQVFVKRL